MTKNRETMEPNRKKEIRIEYLEKLAQSNLYGLNLLASLGELQHDATLARDTSRILNLSADHLQRLLDFQVMAFFMVREEDSNFVLTDVDPESERARIEKEIEDQIENGGFAWSLNQNRPVVVKSNRYGKSLILHVLATKSRVRGMFAGVLREDKRINEATLYPASIILQNTANALESAALYQQISDQNKSLEQIVWKRTQALEEQTQELKQEIVQRRLAEESLLLAKEEAESAGRAKSDFIANISHEFRTPLNAILGYCEVLQYESRKMNRPDLTNDLKAIETAGRHLLGLLNDILDFSKIQAGKMELDLQSFKVTLLVEEVMGTIRPLARKNRNTLSVTYEGFADTMVSDPHRVRQILINLLNNACKFTQDGTVTLKVAGHTKEGSEWITFSVSDTGIGISDEMIPKVFEEFTQTESPTKRTHGGTGLGLAISRRLCHLLGGEITVTSELGEGTIFTVDLPADATAMASGVSEKPVSPMPPPPETPVASSDGKWAPTDKPRPAPSPDKPVTVLVIDSDPISRDLIRRFLDREGFRVEIAANGPDGIERAKRLHPDIISLDAMMPGMDGWTVLSRLKEIPELSRIPVIMLSPVDEKGRALQAGVADFLTKPVDWDQFVEVVKKYRDAPGGTIPILVVEDDMTNRGALCRVLTREGWRVTEAVDGKSALKILDEETPGLILLDLVLPEINGFDFLSQLRKNIRFRSIPVIVISAKELTRKEKERLGKEVDRVFQKGDYTRTELLKEIHQLMGQTQNDQAL